MHTSTRGVAFLERHEGVVLKAYRDPVGIWTIGAGLTKASGVVVPKSGMKITRFEASRLLQAALKRNYEPAVAKAMAGAKQHEFDGGVSFHFNTGAIGRASWVAAWRDGNWQEASRRIRLWKKGGGKVLPGLVRRRGEEFALIKAGIYEGVPPAAGSDTGFARIVVPLSEDELEQVRAAFDTLGYRPGSAPAGILRGSVMLFQRDHDLTIDGIIGRATLSTLQRMLDARRKSVQAGSAGVATAAGSQVDAVADALSNLPLGDHAGAVALALCAIWAGKILWSYRDAVAAAAQSRLPGVAKLLRSF